MRSHHEQGRRAEARGMLARTVAGGVFLLFELPLLLPVIVGWALTEAAVRVRSLATRLEPGPGEGTL